MRPTPRTLFTRLGALAAVLSIAFIAGCSSPEERALSHYERGSEFLEAGDHTRAMLEFRSAIKHDQTLAPAWYGISTIERKAQNWPAVLASLQRVIELDASHVEARTLAAELEFADGDLDRALALVNAANTLRADDADILAMRSAILLRLNDREGARVDAERALYLDRDNPGAYGVLAADAQLDGNTTAALRLVDRGLAAHPMHNGLLLLKLRIHQQEEDHQQSETVLRQLIVANPEDNIIVRRTLVEHLLRQNRREDAETEMRAIVAADPKDVSAALELVRFLGSVKGVDAARLELSQLMEAFPETVDYKLAMARHDLSQKRRDAAVERLEGIISLGEPSADVQRARILLAEVKLQNGEPEAAAGLVAEVLAGDEKNADALALRANLRLQEEDYENATRDLREALGQQPQSVHLLQLLATVFERRGAIDLANDHYVQAVRASNYSPAVALAYADFLSGRRDLERAEAILSESLSRTGNNTAVLRALGEVRVRQQDWVGAQEVAEQLKSIGEGSGAGDELMGLALFAQQKFDQSIAALKGAYATAPQAVRPMYSLVTAYVRSGDVDEARAFLNSVLTANPNNADAHALLGSLHAMNHEMGEAIAAYETAIERQPQNPVGYRALASHLMATDHPNEAEAVLLRGREQVTDDFALNLNLAAVLHRKRDLEGTLAVYEDLLKDRPDSLILVNNVASLLSDYRTDEASLERAYRLAIRLRDVDVPQFKGTLGWIHYRRGEYNSALGLLESAVEGRPESALGRYHLAVTYAALERHEDAKAELERAAEMVSEGDPLGERIRAALNDLGKPQPVN